MKIYWTHKSVPEFKGMSEKEIWKIWWPCYKKTYGHWQQWLMLFFGLITFIGILTFPIVVGGIEKNFGKFLGVMSIGGLFWFLWGHFSVVLGLPYVRAAMKDINSDS